MNPSFRKPLGIMLMAVMLLAACAAGAPPDAPPDADASAGEPAPAHQDAVTEGQDLEEAASEDNPMFHVLAGERAGAEGRGEESAREYLEAALLSKDPAVAQRATRVALAAQAWQYAAMAVDRWVQLAPDDAEARRIAVRTFLVSGDYEQAAWQLSGLLDLTRDTPWQGWRAVPELLSTAQNPVMAGSIADRLVDEHGAADNPYALLTKSQLAARSGDLEAAHTLAGSAVDAAPNEAAMRLWAGRLALTRGDMDEAMEQYRAAWALDPAERATALAYAELLRQSGDIETANDVLSGLPDNPDNRFTRVVFAHEVGDEKLAQSLYEGFSRMPYTDKEATAFNAARSAELLDRPEEAIAWYERLEGTRHEYLALQRRAVLLAQTDRLQEARDLLQYARNSGQSGVQLDTWLIESQLLTEAGQREDAMDALDHAIDQFGDEPRLLYTRALVAVELGRVDVAESDLRAVLAQDPENANALNALGYTLADRTDRLEEAESLIKAAYERLPDEPAVIDSMGWIAFRMGRLEEAESYLRRAFMQDRNAEIAAHLGEVLWAQGRHEDARAIWDEGAQIDAANRVLIETRERLDDEG